MSKLSDKMTLEQFDTGYWYAVELKAFAAQLGVSGVSRLRKDELENLIRSALQGKAAKSLKPQKKSTAAASDKLALDQRVINYTSNKASKDFILQSAMQREPNLPAKSGRWYWLNRWREQQIDQGQAITYADLVDQMITLCRTEGRLPQIPSARFNNFVSDFLEASEGSREDALNAWEELKGQKLAKTYAAWKEAQS